MNISTLCSDSEEYKEEDFIAYAFECYEAWKDAHLTAFPDDEDLTETELINKYYEET